MESKPKKQQPPKPKKDRKELIKEMLEKNNLEAALHHIKELDKAQKQEKEMEKEKKEEFEQMLQQFMEYMATIKKEKNTGASSTRNTNERKQQQANGKAQESLGNKGKQNIQNRKQQSQKATNYGNQNSNKESNPGNQNRGDYQGNNNFSRGFNHSGQRGGCGYRNNASCPPFQGTPYRPQYPGPLSQHFLQGPAGAYHAPSAMHFNHSHGPPPPPHYHNYPPPTSPPQPHYNCPLPLKAESNDGYQERPGLPNQQLPPQQFQINVNLPTNPELGGVKKKERRQCEQQPTTPRVNQRGRGYRGRVGAFRGHNTNGCKQFDKPPRRKAEIADIATEVKVNDDSDDSDGSIKLAEREAKTSQVTLEHKVNAVDKLMKNVKFFYEEIAAKCTERIVRC